MGEISKVFDKITTKKEKLITVEQAFNYLKNLDTNATDDQIAALLIQLSNTIPFVHFDDIKEKFISISDNCTQDLRTYLFAKFDVENPHDYQQYFMERSEEYETRPPFLFPEEMYGWEDSDFYRFLKSKGLKVDHNLVKEEVFIYDGVEFAKLGGVVNEIIRLNPNKAIDKEKTIEILSKSYPSFCFNHIPEDGDILLLVVKKLCDKWGLYFPWQPLDNQNAPANNQDLQTLNQEVQTLKARITELEQANQQLTQALSDSQAETSRLQSELNNRALAGENKPETKSLALKYITEPLKIIQVMQERYYGENFDPNDTDAYPTEKKITSWIRETYKYKEQPALAIYKVGYLPKPKLKK